MVGAGASPLSGAVGQSLLCPPGRGQGHLDRRIPHRHGDGTWRWVRQQGKVVARDRRGQPLRLAGTLSDITDRKTAQLELQRQYQRELLLGKIVREIREKSPGEQIFLRAAIAIGETFGASRCAIYTRDEPQLTATCVAEFLTDQYPSVLGTGFPVAENPFAVSLLTTDRVLAVTNLSKSTELGAWQAQLLAARAQSFMAVRTSDKGRPTGLVVLDQGNYHRQWTESEKSLLQEVASHLGIAFAQADLLAREQQQNNRSSKKIGPWPRPNSRRMRPTGPKVNFWR
ncbi:MAG: GAF domain-containing protein [Oscillatoriales cyanobacterium SM2_1_8]|nr:GAF domain-containing protein [Oscillatoriales cyanobacterium SM2_1_8]